MIRLVELKDIPSVKEVKDVSTDNLVEIFKIAKEMETLCLKENGIGISAVQVGIPLKLFLVRIDDEKIFDQLGFICFVNTKYQPTKKAEKIISLEGCLSIRSSNGQLRHFQVPRYDEIAINGYKLKITGSELDLQPLQNFVLSGNKSILFQHEIDHQLGITIDQIGQEVFLW